MPLPRPEDALAARFRRQEDQLRALARTCNEQARQIADLLARVTELEGEGRNSDSGEVVPE